MPPTHTPTHTTANRVRLISSHQDRQTLKTHTVDCVDDCCGESGGRGKRRCRLRRYGVPGSWWRVNAHSDRRAERRGRGQHPRAPARRASSDEDDDDMDGRGWRAQSETDRASRFSSSRSASSSPTVRGPKKKPFASSPLLSTPDAGVGKFIREHVSYWGPLSVICIVGTFLPANPFLPQRVK